MADVQEQKPNYLLIFVLIGIFSFGMALIILGRAIEPPPTQPFPWHEIARDFGLVFAPLAVIAGVYEFILRTNFNKRIEQLTYGIIRYDLVFPEQRASILDDIVNSTQTNLIVLGITPLFEFAGSKAELLLNKFRKLSSIQIAYLNPNSPYVETRETQSGHTDITAQIRIHENLLVYLRANIPETKLQLIPYDIPPAEFFYLSDGRTLLSTWYPYRRGEDSPCLYIRNLINTEDGRHLQTYYIQSFNHILDSVKPTSHTTTPTPVPK